MIIFYILSIIAKKNNIEVDSGYIVSLPVTVYDDNKDQQLLLKYKNQKYFPSSRVHKTNRFLFVHRSNILKDKKLKLKLNENYDSVEKKQITLFEIRRDLHMYCLETEKTVKSYIINLWSDLIKKKPLEKIADLSILKDKTLDKFIINVLDETVRIIKKCKPNNEKKAAEKIYKILKREYMEYVKDKMSKKSIDELKMNLELFEKTKDMVYHISSFIDPNKVDDSLSSVQIEYGFINRCIIIEMMNTEEKVKSIINENNRMGVVFVQFGNLVIINYDQLMVYSNVTLLIVLENKTERIIVKNLPSKMRFLLKHSFTNKI